MMPTAMRSTPPPAPAPGATTPGNESMMNTPTRLLPPRGCPSAARPAAAHGPNALTALWAPAEDDERWRVIRRLADVRFDEEWPWFPSTLLGPCPVPARSALPAAPI